MTSVLISGASIAGPALAYWLGRYGFRPTVVERVPAISPGGYAVDLRAEAVQVAERMGILGRVRESRTDVREVSLVDGSGRVLARLPYELVSGSPDGRHVEIMRGDLSRILYDASRESAEYVFGDSVTSLTQDDQGVRVTFERAEPRRFDLVIGADGLHSRVRSLAFGPEPEFRRYLGYYIAIASTGHDLGWDRQVRLYNTPGRLAAIYSGQKGEPAKAMFEFACPQPRYDYREVAEQKGVLRTVFAGAGWEVPRLLDGVDAAEDFYFDSLSQIHLETWSRGRVALLGDAGYCASPASGQGTSLALVGAYVLAGELHVAAGEHRTAFRRYERVMRGYVAENQKVASFGTAALVPRTGWQLALRNRLARVLPHVPALNGFSRQMQRSSRSLSLAEYPAFGAGSA